MNKHQFANTQNLSKRSGKKAKYFLIASALFSHWHFSDVRKDTFLTALPTEEHSTTQATTERKAPFELRVDEQADFAGLADNLLALSDKVTFKINRFVTLTYAKLYNKLEPKHIVERFKLIDNENLIENSKSTHEQCLTTPVNSLANTSAKLRYQISSLQPDYDIHLANLSFAENNLGGYQMYPKTIIGESKYRNPHQKTPKALSSPYRYENQPQPVTDKIYYL